MDLHNISYPVKKQTAVLSSTREYPLNIWIQLCSTKKKSLWSIEWLRRKFMNHVCMDQWIFQNFSISILILGFTYNDLWSLIFTLSRWYRDAVCQAVYPVLKTEIVKNIISSTVPVCCIAISCNVTFCAVELNMRSIRLDLVYVNM